MTEREEFEAALAAWLAGMRCETDETLALMRAEVWRRYLIAEQATAPTWRRIAHAVSLIVADRAMLFAQLEETT